MLRNTVGYRQFHLYFRTKHKVENQDICIFVVIADSMVLCAKIGPSILNADLSDLAGECSRLLDQVCLWRIASEGGEGREERKQESKYIYGREREANKGLVREK